MSGLPLGPSWYAFRVKRATGTQLTPNEIHSIGIAEVERLQARMQSLPLNPPPGCRFHTRCWKAQDICQTIEPPLDELAPGHRAACHFPEPPR